MKILHFVYWYGADGAGGGMEVYTRRLMDKFESQGHTNVVLYVVPFEPLPNVAGRATFQLHSDSSNAKVATVKQRLDSIIESEQPDAAVVYTAGPAEAIEHLIERLPTLFIALTHATYCPSGGKYFQRGDEICTVQWGPVCLLNAYLKKCDTRRPGPLWEHYRRTWGARRWLKQVPCIIAPSEYIRDQLLAEGVAPDRLVLLPHAVDIPSQVGPPPAGDVVVLGAARFEPAKGVHYLLAAMKQLPDSYRLVLAGDGYQRAELERRAHDLGVAGRTTFLGQIPLAELSTWYQRSHVVVVPSVWPEPFGLVGPDAMAHGRPVIAFAVGGIPDWLTDGETGFLVKSRDVASLAAQIRVLGDNPTLARQMGQRGREVAEERFTVEGHVHELWRILHGLIEARRDT